MHAVVSANLARAAFPGLPLDRVVGQWINVLTRRGSREIIGVVDDVSTDVYGKPSGVVYSAHRQFAGNRNWALTQVVAADAPPERILQEVRAVVASMDPELVVYRPAAMTEVVGRGVSRERFALVLMGAFAGVSVILAALGLYGVLACAVRERTAEIGIRIALGATPAHIRFTILRQAGFVLGLGLVAGAAGAFVLGRWLTSFAFGISASDPLIIMSAALLLAMTGLLAAWLPARRAVRVSPRIAMQEGY
jgi:putative ABC transport system permease protein